MKVLRHSFLALVALFTIGFAYTSPVAAQQWKTFEGRFRAMNDWGTSRGYASCFPNFHQANTSAGAVLGAICLRKVSGIQFQDLYAVDLRYPNSPAARFRAVSDWASKNGWLSGYPNFHEIDRGKGKFYGSILFRSSAADFRDIRAEELGNPSDDTARFRAVSNWATERGYVGGFPNFNQANYGRGVVYGAILIKPGYGQFVDIPVRQLN